MGIEVIALLAAFATAFLFSAWLASEDSPFKLLDKPNDRSLHTRPIPSCGGSAIVAGIALGWLIIWPESADYVWIALAALIVAMISFVDDLRMLPPLLRLVTHLIAAALLVTGGVMPDWDGLVAVLVVIGTAWMINLYNFMDGMDGLAGGMALFGFGFLGMAGYLAGHHEYAMVCWVISAAAVGFLMINFHPARLFMGDTGATTLGLLAVAMALMGIDAELFPLWFPPLVFSPFIIDASVTLARRALNGEKFWQPHCSHYYQRLVRVGWGHKRTALAEYGLMSACGLSGLVMLNHNAEIVAWGLCVWLAIYLGLIAMVHRLEGGRVGTQPRSGER